MRAQFSRVTSARFLGLLLGMSMGVLAPVGLARMAQAQEAPLASGAPADPSPAPAMLGAPQNSAAELRLPPPELPAPLVVDAVDVTGSIGVTPQGAPEGDASAMPPALPLDDQAVAKPAPPPQPAAPGSSTPADPARPKDDAASVPAAQQATAQPSTPDSAPAAGTPATPPLDASTVAPAAASAATPGQGLQPADLAQALAAFGSDKFATPETNAQAAERRKSREAIAAYYAAHRNQPLWIADAHFTPAARMLLGRLDHAAEDGLDLRRFAVAMPRSSDTATLAQAELALSEAVVAYGRQATGVRVDVAKLGGIIDLRPEIAEPAHILDVVATATDAGDALRDFNPPQSGYAALREQLATVRQRSVPAEAQNRIPAGPVLKPGMKDARVPLVRARFGLDVTATDAAPALVYDTKVAAAVAEFQRANGLPASGTLTRRTIAALSGGNPARLENAIVANMEEWRWLLRDLGPDRVEVNIPDYSVQVVRDRAVVHRARVVVGQADKPTPVFAQQMKFIIVNPYWNVPLSIINKEMMPKLAADPTYFQDHGYEVVQRNGITYVRQPPGDDNALGRIKFMFPNQHSVYLHDTNARSFFGRDKRALSHGCVRVDRPFSFAEAVMGPDSGWTEARVKSLIGGKERTINLPKPLPIYIEYFTAFVDPETGFHLRDDVYGYEGKVKLALGLQD